MKRIILKYAFLSILIFPVDVYANVGLPMIAYGFPFMIVLFAPVLRIEILIYKIKLDKGFWSAFKVAGIANLYTTIIGYPISWFLLLIYQLIASIVLWGLEYILPIGLIKNEIITFISIPFIMPAWIAPFYGYPIGLIMCLAGMVGLIPAYWITVSSEKKILRRFWGDDKNLDSICILANRLSYLFLYSVLIISYLYFLMEKF